MPDANKLAKLREIEYVLHPSCAMCAHYRGAPGASFGSCTQFEYEHEKQGKKPLSVHSHGSCPKFEMNEKKGTDIDRSGFSEFVCAAHGPKL